MRSGLATMVAQSWRHSPATRTPHENPFGAEADGEIQKEEESI